MTDTVHHTTDVPKRMTWVEGALSSKCWIFLLAGLAVLFNLLAPYAHKCMVDWYFLKSPATPSPPAIFPQYVHSCILGLSYSQFPILWLWVRCFTPSRYARIYLDYGLSHLLALSLLIGSALALERPIEGLSGLIFGLQLDWIVYYLQGFFIFLLIYLLGLRHSGPNSLFLSHKTNSNFSLSQLFGLMTLLTLVTAESIFLTAVIFLGLISFFGLELVEPISLFFVASFCATLFVTLLLGVLYHPQRMRFLISLIALAALGPYALLQIFIHIAAPVTLENQIAFLLANGAFAVGTVIGIICLSPWIRRNSGNCAQFYSPQSNAS